MTIKEFLGTNLRYDNDCQVIYAVQPDGHDQLILDIRGWGKIQHLFPNIKDAAKFQDELGKFYAEAIKEKLERL